MTNAFGGGNSNSLYVPMSLDEQEALLRVVESHEMIVKIKGWGECHPIIQFGDSRVSMYLELAFTSPAVPVPVSFFDLELWHNGVLLRKDRVSLVYDNKPMMIGAGVVLNTVWEMSIHHMDPKWVKQMTGAKGLTTKVLDKTTGAATLQGNMTLSEDRMKMLHMLRQSEARIRAEVEAERIRALKMQEAAEKRGEIIKLDVPD